MSREKTSPIGIFDSGLGGLTVFREIEKLLPAEHLIYFGDTARVPYGTKSKNTIIRFSTENVLFLLKKKVKLVVVACNTASSLALDYLTKVFTVPIIGVIEAGVQKAHRVSKSRSIGVIATTATISSMQYEKKLRKLDTNITVLTKACPLFVPLAEEGMVKGSIVDAIVTLYLAEIKGRIDTLILGCTHYPLLKKAIASYLKGVYLVDSAYEVARATRKLLEDHALLNTVSRQGKKEFYVTDEPKAFARVAKNFLKRTVARPKIVNL